MASKEIAVPEHLKKYLANTQTSSDADSMASASISIPRISLRGRKFRLIEGGEEIRKPADEFLGVILGVEPGPGLNQKTYYSKGYQSGDSAPPDCSSANGVTPDTWIASPVHNRCRDCPMNIFGSAKSNSGKKSKACKDSKRLWVAEPDKLEGTVYALGVPVTSLKAMAEYGAMLKANGIPSAAVITQFTMKDTEFPELMFDYVGVLEQTTMEQAMLRNEQKDWNTGGGAPLLTHDTGPISAPGADKAKPAAMLENKSEPTGEKAPALTADQAVEGWD